MRRSHTWDGLLRADDRTTDGRARNKALADAAHDASWNAVLRLLDDDPLLSPNQWRTGGTSWYTPLHQAAWHGADKQVVEALVDHGGWLGMRTADGQTPRDVALARGHLSLADELQPATIKHVEPAVLEWLDIQLAKLVDNRIRPHLTVELRYPTTEVLTEMGDEPLWFPVPGMYGGFSIKLMRSYLFVESWCRVAGGSGQAHVVTADGFTLVEQGFV